MFKVEWNGGQFERGLSDVANRQLPFALMLTINDATDDIKANTLKTLEKKFDRPTPFTKRGVYTRRASKRRLIGEVGFKKIQAEYLMLNITGGIRLPKRNAILMPVAQRKNKYGNLPRGSVKRAVARRDTFVASKNDPRTRHLQPGIYKRKSKSRRRAAGAVLLVSFRDRAKYRKRYDFHDAAEKTALVVLPRHFVKNMRRAMATAK